MTSALQMPGIDANACDLAQQAAKEEWDYLTFLEQALQWQGLKPVLLVRQI